MNMNLKKACLLVACAAFLTGCADKMDYHEYQTYGPDYVFTDFGRTAGFVNNIYASLDYDLLGSGSRASACDEAEMAITYSSIFDYTNGNWSALNPYSWFGYYAPIREANYFLKNGVERDFIDHRYDEDYQAQMNRYNRYQYEVRLLRAYYYFLLVRAYGDVPFTTEVLTEAEANSITRTPAADVFDFIVKECDAVAPELPVDYSKLDNDAAGNSDNPETGRVNRGMALALKARTLLYRASKLFSPTQDKELYRQAAKANLDVINYCSENGIKLGKYTDIWGENNWKASEMIFVRRVGSTTDPEVTNFPISMENANSGNCPTQTLVDAYQRTDGNYLTVEQAVRAGLDPYADLDPRFGMTIARNGEKWPNTNTMELETFVGGRDGAPLPYATTTSYYVKKYVDGSTDISASTGSGGKTHSWVTFRLGEFLMNYAEAAFKYFDSPDQTNDELTLSAREAINQVRNRSDVKMPALPESMDNNYFWTVYKNERMVELAFEGHRFWDVRRWKEGGFTSIDRLVITKEADGSLSYSRTTKNLVWDDKMYFYPIPDSEIRKNPNLSQNAGW